MTRRSKIKFLKARGNEIDWHLRDTDRRLIIDAIKIDGQWKTFRTINEDQVAAGQYIDLLYYEFMED